MKLKDYLKKNNMSVAEMARLLNCHPQTLRGYIAGKRYPVGYMMKVIEGFTDGDVTYKDFEAIRKCEACGRPLWKKNL